MIKYKSGQEEMVGFVMIVIIVAIAMLFLLEFYIRSDKNKGVESYEAESFIQSLLHYTTDCGNFLGKFSVQKLIIECSKNSVCQDGRNSCGVLNSTLREIVKESWKVGEERPVKGYEMIVYSDKKELVTVNAGNNEGNFKGSMQGLPGSIEITFRAYYGS